MTPDILNQTHPRVTDKRFAWTGFYETFADKLLEFRSEDKLAELARQASSMPPLVSFLEDGGSSSLEEGGAVVYLCPFTVMASFNHETSWNERSATARRLAEWMGMDESIVPSEFRGIPSLDAQNWGPFHSRKDIPYLWDAFASAIALADAPDDINMRKEFEHGYDKALTIHRIGSVKLTQWMFWARPWSFFPLDKNSVQFVNNNHYIPRRINSGRLIHAKEYLAILDELRQRMPGHNLAKSFPEIALRANQDDNSEYDDSANEDSLPEGELSSPAEPYGIENIARDGCFLDPPEIEKSLARLRDKQNLILQGPPGTGKTWLAKRLAYALMGEKARDRVQAVQFHPTLSYEDFVRGWRPDGNGGLELADGALMHMVQAAKKAPGYKHVLVIEEINRGNPAQIFGEMLTLLENSKPSKADAMELAYPRPGERVHVPANLYVIGTMNLADRSLAMVDLALRRRFAFHTLAPLFNAAWDRWLAARDVDKDSANKIRAKMEALNTTIAADPELGAQFCVGHSYVTPRPDEKIPDATAWFRAIVQSEIAPLLEEYWHDKPDKAADETAKLLAGF